MDLDKGPNDYPVFIEVVHKLVVPAGKQLERLDTFLARHLKNVSRTKIQKAIELGNVTVNGAVAKANRKVKPNDIIECKLRRLPPLALVPEPIPLDIVFEDEHIIVINKPAGMVTHPGYGNWRGTLVNALLYHLGQREVIELKDEEFDDEEETNEGVIFASEKIRPGIVHRLDKDTSGLILVSKNPELHQSLAEQFTRRTVERYYYALVWGEFDHSEGTYQGDIGRSPRNRKLFAVVKSGGKSAITNYWVVRAFPYVTLVKVKLLTGRTHQIRVHFSHNMHPLLGDPSYGGDSVVYGGHSVRFKQVAVRILKNINRQMLHSKVLGFYHPVRKEFMRFEVDFPADMKYALEELENFSKTIE